MVYKHGNICIALATKFTFQADIPTSILTLNYTYLTR